MSEIIYRNELFEITCFDEEFLYSQGIRKFFNDCKIVALDKTHRPEGGEWSFMYDGKLNRLYIEKDGNTYKFTGDISPEILGKLKDCLKNIK